MEIIKNSNIKIHIHSIDNISGAFQNFVISFTEGNGMIAPTDGRKGKLIFDNVLDMRYTTENGCLDRFAKFAHAEKRTSDIIVVENSEYIEHFKRESSGIWGQSPDELIDFIITDEIDTVIEILTTKDPILV